MTTDLAPGDLDLARFIRAGDRIVVGQGCAEARTLTEALVAQRAAIGRARVFLGPSFAGTFRPEHGDHLGFTAYGCCRGCRSAQRRRASPGRWRRWYRTAPPSSSPSARSPTRFWGRSPAIAISASIPA